MWNMERVKITKTVDRELFQQIRNSTVIFGQYLSFEM